MREGKHNEGGKTEGGRENTMREGKQKEGGKTEGGRACYEKQNC